MINNFILILLIQTCLTVCTFSQDTTGIFKHKEIASSAIFSFFGSTLSKSAKKIDSLGYRLKEQNGINSELTNIIYSNGEKETLLFLVAKEDSVINGVYYSTSKSALPVLLHLASLGYKLINKEFGDNVGYYCFEDNIEIILMEHSSYEMTYVSISHSPILDIITTRYNSPEMKEKEIGKWNLFKEIINLRNSKGKTMEEELSAETKTFSYYKINEIPNCISKNNFSRVDDILNSQFLSDSGFIEKYKKLLGGLLNLDPNKRPSAIPSSTKRVIENYIQYFDKKSFLYSMCYLNSQLKLR